MAFARVPFPGHQSLALLSVLGGGAVAIAGVVEFSRRRTTVNPMAPDRATSVVDTGIYRYSRNPMYLGMALTLLGVALWWVSIPGIAVVAAFCVYITRYQIRPEERALLSLFGDEFRAYMARVRRWI